MTTLHEDRDARWRTAQGSLPAPVVVAPRWAGAWPPRAFWRNSAIGSIKPAHTAIFLVNSAAILHIFVAGIRNHPSPWTGPALAVALAESTVFVANRGRCPLTNMAEGLGAKSGRVSDIFLPRWFADRIPQIRTPPLLIGMLALAFNTWRHAARRTTKRTPRKEPAHE